MLEPKLLDSLGNWNPQLLRELKGQLKPSNLILAGATSLGGQLLLFIAFLGRIPRGTLDKPTVFPKSDPYCTGFIVYGNDRKCLADAAGNLVVDWQRWSLDLFLVLSIIGIFSLLVVGTYLLIDNLVREERKGTLDFIRQSPRSPQNILWGKILGVPVLIYIVALLAIPLHLGMGLAAYIPLIRILGFYGILAFSCLSFYSCALLFSLISLGALSGFQSLLGSGIVFLVIFVGSRSEVLSNSIDWIKFFSPALILQYLISATGIQSTNLFLNLEIQQIHWFNLPVGTGMVGIAGILLLNYSLWTYWSWQSIQRRFLNPSKTIFSKSQSYLLVACFEVMALGFAGSARPYYPMENFIFLLAYNFVLFLGLIMTLTPQKQALVDWARYRKQKPSSRRGLLNLSLLRELAIGENSPAILAIALNAVIAFIILSPWIVASYDGNNKLSFLMALVLSLSLIIIGATIAQLVVFMQTRQQEFWIVGVLSAVTILPPLTLGLLSVDIHTNPSLWLFTVFAFEAVNYTKLSSVFLILLGQLSLLSLGALQVTRQLKKVGASDSISLFASQPKIKPTSN